MKRVLLVSSEALRPRLAGIGVRYLELAGRLAESGFAVRVTSPARPEETAETGLAGCEVVPFEPVRLTALAAGCDAVVAQGQLANDVVLALPELPAAIDLYDPWLIENCAYVETLGLDPYRNDHASWVLQLSRGDFFLCSSEEQRLFYTGFLTALGRVHPERLRADPDLAGLLAVVPFGLPEELPAPRPLLPPRRPGERRLLFGGLYDWYDPWPLLAALAAAERPEWTLLLVRNPNPEATPQRLFGEVERWCRERGLWGTQVQVLDWLPAERRFDLLREVDVMVALHRATLETRLALRTRFLDALAVGCPVITSAGGTIARLLTEADAGWVVPPGDVAAVGAALGAALADDGPAAALVARGREVARRFRWQAALAPLAAFLAAPRVDTSKERFGFRPPTVAPADGLAFRARRLARRLAPGGGGGR